MARGFLIAEVLSDLRQLKTVYVCIMVDKNLPVNLYRVDLIIMSIGERLKEERERLRLSQTQFADLVGASKHAQIKWEKNLASPNAVALAAWAEHGVDVAYVVTGNSEFERPPVLTVKEQLILESFRNGLPEQQEFILKAALGFGKDLVKGPKATQIFHGEVGQSVVTEKLDQRGIRFFGGKSKK